MELFIQKLINLKAEPRVIFPIDWFQNIFSKNQQSLAPVHFLIDYHMHYN